MPDTITFKLENGMDNIKRLEQYHFGCSSYYTSGIREHYLIIPSNILLCSIKKSHFEAII